MPVRNGNLGNDRTTTTKAASVRKQLGTKSSKSNEGRQAKNGGVKGRDRSAGELDRETGEEQTIVETREAKAEAGGLCSQRCEEGRRRGRRRQDTENGGKDYQMRR